MKVLALLTVVLAFSYFTYWIGRYQGYEGAARDLGYVAELATGMINKCVNGIPYQRSGE